jgi:hypothetical protein
MSRVKNASYSQTFGKWLQNLNTCEVTGYGAGPEALDRMYYNFEQGVCFKIGKKLWDNHHDVYDSHIKYLKNYIQKPFGMGVRNFDDCLRTMFDLKKHLQPSSIKCQDAWAADWERLEKTTPDKEQHEAIIDALPATWKQKLNTHETDWRSMEENVFIDALCQIERDDDINCKAKNAKKEKKKAERKRKADKDKGAKNKKRASGMKEKQPSAGGARRWA